MKFEDIAIKIAFLATSSASTLQCSYSEEVLFANVKLENGVFDSNLIPQYKIKQVYDIEELIKSSKSKINLQKPKIENFLDQLYSPKNFLAHVNRQYHSTYKSNQR